MAFPRFQVMLGRRDTSAAYKLASGVIPTR